MNDPYASTSACWVSMVSEINSLASFKATGTYEESRTGHHYIFANFLPYSNQRGGGEADYTPQFSLHSGSPDPDRCQ